MNSLAELSRLSHPEDIEVIQIRDQAILNVGWSESGSIPPAENETVNLTSSNQSGLNKGSSKTLR